MHSEIDKNKIENGFYIVSTPIGNLEDITLRAINILRSSKYILCEDTRIAQKLINHFKIKSKLISNHKFNEKKNLSKLSGIITSSKIISLITDAGTPLISDPGKIIVQECIKKRIKVIPIPGASAVTAAMSISGFSDKFHFRGFLPEKLSQIREEFSLTSKINSSIVFFISSKKINKVIPIIKEFFFDRKIIICKEITKFYEQFYRFDVSELKKDLFNLRGEITIVISEKKGQKKNPKLLSESDKILIQKLINKLSVKDIIEILSHEKKISKSKVYNYCLKIKNENKAT